MSINNNVREAASSWRLTKLAARTWRRHSSLIMRLPSLAIGDFILSCSDQLYDEMEARLGFALNSFFLSLATRSTVLIGLFGASLLFSLGIAHIRRFYKVLALVSLPFVFTWLIDAAHHLRPPTSPSLLDDHHALVSTLVVPLATLHAAAYWSLVVLIYAGIATLAMRLYVDTFVELISDRRRMYDGYAAIVRQHREAVDAAAAAAASADSDETADAANNNGGGGDDVDDELHVSMSLSEYVDYLVDKYYSEDDDADDNNQETAAATAAADRGDIEVDEEAQANAVRLRRLYILAYFALALFVNEWLDSRPPYNIVSLGYLLLLTYDLSSAMDQIILRLLVQAKRLRKLVASYGFNEFLSHNWFKRLRVPHTLRVYLLVKCVSFALKFALFRHSYAQLDAKMASDEASATHAYSIVYAVLGWFSSASSATPNSSEFPTNATATLIASDGGGEESNQSGITCELFARMLLVHLTENTMGIAGLASLMSYKFHYFGAFVNRLVVAKAKPTPSAATIAAHRAAANHNNNANANADENNNDPHELVNVGDVAAILFFLMSVQTGLSYLNGRQRVEKFLKNYLLLFVAVLHFLHNGIDQRLMSQNAASRLNRRLVAVCSAFVVTPVVILCAVWRYTSVSTWLMAATAFNVDLIVKTIISLALYMLFYVDARRLRLAYENTKRNDDAHLSPFDRTSSASAPTRQQQQQNDNEELLVDGDDFSAHLDEYVYYLKAFGELLL